MKKTHVTKTGVMSDAYTVENDGGTWSVHAPQVVYYARTKATALAWISNDMGDWLTMPEARAMLVKAGIIKAVSDVQFCRWLAAGRFTGAKKVAARGRGGSWRIPLATVEGMINE